MGDRNFWFTIRKNDTGETIRERCWGPWEEQTEFFLTQGNLGCDCNRDLLWRRAKGLPLDESNYCNGYGKYSITKIEFDDGEVMEELEW